eukprot:763111-Hanusia_phi.AAC.3
MMRQNDFWSTQVVEQKIKGVKKHGYANELLDSNDGGGGKASHSWCQLSLLTLIAKSNVKIFACNDGDIPRRDARLEDWEQASPCYT